VEGVVINTVGCDASVLTTLLRVGVEEVVVVGVWVVVDVVVVVVVVIVVVGEEEVVVVAVVLVVVVTAVGEVVGEAVVGVLCVSLWI
jgi:hypothetical protein